MGDGASGSTKLSPPESLLLAALEAVLCHSALRLRLWAGVRQMQMDDDSKLPKVGQIALDLTNFTDVKQPVPRDIFVDVPVGIFLDVENATNHTNVQEINYSYNYQQQATVNGLPMLPTLGIKGEF